LSNKKSFSRTNQNLRENEISFKKTLIRFTMKKKWFPKLLKCWQRD